MIRKILILTALVAASFVSTKPASAQDYCREYTKTVSIGGRAEQAYGTACYRPDGSWEIVDLQGSDYARDQVREVMYRDIEKDRYQRGYKPSQRVVVVENYRYRNTRPVYYRQAATQWPFVFSFNYGNNYNNKYKNNYRNNHYRDFKHDNRGNNRGHGNDRGRGGHNGKHK